MNESVFSTAINKEKTVSVRSDTDGQTFALRRNGGQVAEVVM